MLFANLALKPLRFFSLHSFNKKLRKPCLENGSLFLTFSNNCRSYYQCGCSQTWHASENGNSLSLPRFSIVSNVRQWLSLSTAGSLCTAFFFFSVLRMHISHVTGGFLSVRLLKAYIRPHSGNWNRKKQKCNVEVKTTALTTTRTIMPTTITAVICLITINITGNRDP